ncbi:hypothetical protein SAMN04488128_108104 [Chitinophaga eiseniae]|uniref:Uncharacterized protein n=1 Tax=Chitinophaga eiseniae TaxID=634771 RepID=A0A1T4U373_9BACT|nr:hypothetical protein SAMN04488128_108104 [Chitinophaga eiseniae]
MQRSATGENPPFTDNTLPPARVLFSIPPGWYCFAKQIKRHEHPGTGSNVN